MTNSSLQSLSLHLKNVMNIYMYFLTTFGTKKSNVGRLEAFLILTFISCVAEYFRVFSVGDGLEPNHSEFSNSHVDPASHSSPSLKRDGCFSRKQKTLFLNLHTVH